MAAYKISDISMALAEELKRNPDTKVVNISAASARAIIKFVNKHADDYLEKEQKVERLEHMQESKERAVMMAESKRRSAEARLAKAVEEHKKAVHRLRKVKNEITEIGHE